jgi:hypothetical protein
VGVQAVPAHGRAVPTAPVRGDHPLAAVDVGDRPVTEARHAVDDLADPFVVRAAYDAQLSVRDPAADDDDGDLLVQGGERVGGGGRAEQDQGLTAKGQQRFEAVFWSLVRVWVLRTRS